MYERTGRAAAILENHLGLALQRMSSDASKSLRNILITLVTSEGTRAALSVPEMARRARLTEHFVDRLINEAVHAERLVREISGQPVRYELAHDLLAEAVGKWRDDDLLRTRQIQEILDQEIASAKTREGFSFPPDKLRLVDDQRDKLDLQDDAIVFVSQAIAMRSALPSFWRKKLEGLPFERRCEAALGIQCSEYNCAVAAAVAAFR